MQDNQAVTLHLPRTQRTGRLVDFIPSRGLKHEDEKQKEKSHCIGKCSGWY
ncbi:hypothetical protein ACV1BL_16650 [Serratia marcescens]